MIAGRAGAGETVPDGSSQRRRTPGNPCHFGWTLTAWVLRRREKNAVDRWDDGHYSRVIVVDGDPVQLTVTQDTARVEPTLVVTVESTTRISARVRKEAGLLVQRMLGLAVDLQPFYRLARDNAVIGPLVERFAGVRPPRFPTLRGTLNDREGRLLEQVARAASGRRLTRSAVRDVLPTPADGPTCPRIVRDRVQLSEAQAIQEMSPRRCGREI